MAFIPKGSRWYLADIVQRFRVEGDPRSVVHINTVLIDADSPEVAFRKAMKRGRSENMVYLNPEGKKVTTRFLGLRDLNVIHDPLEDGCELAYQEHVGWTDAASRKLVRPRSALGVFRPLRPSPGPDYRDGETMAEAMKRVKKLRRARRAS